MFVRPVMSHVGCWGEISVFFLMHSFGSVLLPNVWVAVYRMRSEQHDLKLVMLHLQLWPVFTCSSLKIQVPSLLRVCMPFIENHRASEHFPFKAVSILAGPSPFDAWAKQLNIHAVWLCRVCLTRSSTFFIVLEFYSENWTTSGSEVLTFSRSSVKSTGQLWL